MKLVWIAFMLVSVNGEPCLPSCPSILDRVSVPDLVENGFQKSVPGHG